MIQRRKQLSGQLLTMVIKERSKSRCDFKRYFDDTHELDANSIVVKTLHIMKKERL